MADNAKWYVAHTYSGYENAVKAAIEKSVVNRGMEGTAQVEVNLKAFGEARLVEAVQLSNPDHTWAASMEDSTSVEPKAIGGASIVDGVLKAELPAVSWAMFRIATA